VGLSTSSFCCVIAAPDSFWLRPIRHDLTHRSRARAERIFTWDCATNCPDRARERRIPGMKLTRLRLLGFKSFVEPTDFLIEPGLTGVVGPNGCGKSNLVEALRWVMG